MRSASDTSAARHRIKQKRVHPDTDDSNSDSNGDSDGDSDSDASGGDKIKSANDAPAYVVSLSPERNTRGNVIRQAAKIAMEHIRLSDRRQWGSAKKRRVRRSGQESKTEEDDPAGYMNELLNRLVDKKTTNDIVYYRADWTEYKDTDDHYTWEPVENLKGHEVWMELVDQWKIDHEPKGVSFAAFVKNNARAIRLGDGERMRCFFFAVEAGRRLLDLDHFDVNKVVELMDQEDWDGANGVKKSATVPLMRAIAKAGMRIDHKVWAQNRHKTEYGPCPSGVCRSLEDSAGVYMVATIDPRRMDHCWILSVGEESMMTVFDNGAKTSFSDLRFHEILWVRRCVPFVMKPRKHRPSKKKTKRAKTVSAEATAELMQH